MKSTPHCLSALLVLLTLLSGCAADGELPIRASDASRYMVSPGPLAECVPGAPGNQWAAVIGVNQYKDGRIPDLSGAVNDAWVLFHYLASPGGGRIDQSRLRLLLNEEATHRNVMGVLGNFLSKACPQDQVIIYFAGHGAPEPGRPEESFLLLHDTDLSNLVGSAVSMSRLPDFLKWRTGQTGRLLMLVDACHSGAIQFPGGSGVRGALPKDRVQLVSKGLDRVVTQFPGWGALSAAATDQFAMETDQNTCALGGQVYSGGVFTCRVLEGLVGRADEDGDGTVVLDELYRYLETTVKADTGDQQAPQLSGNLEAGMPLAQVKSEVAISIPSIPQAYLHKEAHRDPSLRPFVWTGAGLTAAAAITGAVFNVRAELLASDINSGVVGKDEAFEQLQTTAFVGYGVAGAFLAATVAVWLIDNRESPRRDVNVYEAPPWFELTPHEGGVMGRLRLVW